MKQNPLLIVLTPVMNEAWILPAFLKATSLWADYIIIADQMSTDGSRELYDAYKSERCKLIVIDNPRKEMHQAATRRLLFEEARKIEGDKILFALDADEFLSGNFVETEGWKTIMNSEPGDVFEFRWMNISSDVQKYTKCETPYYWATHVNEELWKGSFPDNFIHEWRLPWPSKVNHEYIVDDISFIHYARVNAKREVNKERFYQVSQSASMGKYSGVLFFRTYNPISDNDMYDVPVDVYKFYDEHGVNLYGLLKLDEIGEHYTRRILKLFDEKGISYFRKLDIWSEDFLSDNKLSDPRHIVDKILHWYLRKTIPYANLIIIRGIDKILKLCY